MGRMRLFVDTNIILKYIEHRPEYESVRRVLTAIRNGQHEGFISQGCVYTLAYLAEKALKANGFHKPELTIQLRKIMTSILALLEPVGISRTDMLNAIGNEAFTDMEDSFQYQSAPNGNCNVLLTININDFKEASQQRMEILTPLQFVGNYMKKE